jgi:cobalamin synthase
MRRAANLLSAIAALTAVALFGFVEPALAEPSDVGQNLGDEVKAWGTALLLGVAALVGLPALAKREVNQALVIALIVVVLGGFIFAGDTVKSVIDSLWNVLDG